MSFGDACLYSLAGIMVVFFALVLLLLIIVIMTAIGDRAEKKAAAVPASGPAAPVSAPVPEEPKAAPRKRELKLWDTDPRTAAMIMAIVADSSGIPLERLHFLSIREIKGDS